MRRLEPNELPQLFLWLQSHQPKSAVISQWMKVNLDRPGGCGTSEKVECYVDEWPHPHIAAGVDRIRSYGVEDYPKFCVFTDYIEGELKKVEMFLMELNEVLGIKNVGGCEAKGVSMDLEPVLRKAYADILGLNASICSWPCRGYLIPEEERRRLRDQDIEAPSGFEFGTLELKEAPYVDATWPLRVEGSSLPMIRRQIRDFPNVCLREANGERRLACFELIEAEIGLMSHLYTVPEFRRRGLARVVELKLAQLLIKEGIAPVKVVVHGNGAGEEITKGCPMWKYFGDVIWIRYGNAEMAERYAEADGH